MIVVDTNVIAYLLIRGTHTAQARRALQRDPVWAAPVLWRSEFRSVLVQYVRSAQLDLPDAVALMDEATLLVADAEYQVRSDDVLRLAAQSRCSAYDCEFVALARDLRVPLVTTDRQIVRAFASTAVGLAEWGKN